MRLGLFGCEGGREVMWKSWLEGGIALAFGLVNIGAFWIRLVGLEYVGCGFVGDLWGLDG